MSRFNPDYLAKCGKLYLVYKWSPRWKWYVNTHAFPEDMYEEAKACVRKFKKDDGKIGHLVTPKQ